MQSIERLKLQARMVVITKTDKDPVLPQSYRPICILNVDYMILMSILAGRMNSIVDSYLHLDQSVPQEQVLKGQH